MTKEEAMVWDTAHQELTAQVWQVAQDVQTAYRAALKPTAVLPTNFDRWLREETKDIGV